MDEYRKWLGRGYENVPGQPFGYAHMMEREAIRRHLRRRILKFGLDGLASARLEFRVTAIQQRIHRNAPTFAQRQAKWKAAQPAPAEVVLPLRRTQATTTVRLVPEGDPPPQRAPPCLA